MGSLMLIDEDLIDGFFDGRDEVYFYWDKKRKVMIEKWTSGKLKGEKFETKCKSLREARKEAHEIIDEIEKGTYLLLKMA